MRFTSVIMAALALIFLRPPAHAAEWDQFRGPNGSGVAETGALPLHFSPTENLVWRAPLGEGHSSPILTDAFVFLTAEQGEELLTICLSRDDGHEVWTRSAPRDRAEELDSRNNSASPTPVTDGDAVFVFFNDYGLISYDLDGAERWRLPLGPFDNGYGMGVSPILAGEKVVLVCDQNTDSFIIAVDKKSGEVAWKIPRAEAGSGHSTPVSYQSPSGETQILAPGSFLLSAYAADSGEKIWWAGGLSYEMKSTPVMTEDMIFVNGYGSPLNQPDQIVDMGEYAPALAKYDANRDGRLTSDELTVAAPGWWFEFVDLDHDDQLNAHDWEFLRATRASKNGMIGIRLGGRGDVTASNTVWDYSRAVPQLPSPLIYRGVLYMINDRGITTSFRPVDGEVIAKGRLKGAMDNYYASPIASDGKIYITSEGGKVAVLGPGGGLDVLAVNEMGEPCYATPAIGGGRIYLRTTESLYCFGLPDEARPE